MRNKTFRVSYYRDRPEVTVLSWVEYVCVLLPEKS